MTKPQQNMFLIYDKTYVLTLLIYSLEGLIFNQISIFKILFYKFAQMFLKVCLVGVLVGVFGRCFGRCAW